ncbi:MAG: hypothetical protein AAFQ94_08445 [Bacteroidota bacterium]
MNLLKTLTLSLLLMLSGFVFSQEHSLSVAAGYVNTGYGGQGPVIHVEPVFKNADPFKVGFRCEISKIAKTYNGQSLRTRGVDFSVSPNVQYFIDKTNHQYILGFGAGVFSRGSFFNPDDQDDFLATQLFCGFYPRVGVQYKQMSIIAEYNIVPGLARRSPFLGDSNISSSSIGKNSYLSIKAAFNFFGA